MFWLLFVVIAISTVPAAVYSATEAMRQFSASRRLVALAKADQSLLASNQSLMLERGITIIALSTAPVADRSVDSDRIAAIRLQAEADAQDSERRLEQVGYPALANTVRQAVQIFADTRPVTDAALQHPLSERDHAQPDAVFRTHQQTAAMLNGVQDEIDVAMRQNNPDVGRLVAVKHMLLEARAKFGMSSYHLSIALQNQQVLSRSELAAECELHGTARAAWDLATLLAQDDHSAVHLKAAIVVAMQRYFSGAVADLRSAAMGSLKAGVPTTVDVAAFRKQEGAALQFLGAAAAAADQDMVQMSEANAAAALRAATGRGIAVLVALLVVVFGLWTGRMLQAKTREQAQSEAGERQAIENGQIRLAAEQAAAADAAALVVGSIGAGLERLARGDLSFRLTTPLPAPYENLRADLNMAFDELEAMVTRIIAGTSGIRLGIDDITQAADDLNDRTEQQTASLRQTTAAVQEVTTMVRKTEDVAHHATAIVVQTRAGAEQSDDVVRRAVTAMAEIEASSKQIGQIVGVIDRIAAQTNLLALNAGVEAARAGEAGRGFAVVASEVKQLASRSAEAAKQIKRLITSSTEQVSDGVRLVGEAGQSFIRIIGQVGEISGAVMDIATSAKEQSVGLTKVNTAIGQMDQIVDKTVQMVEQSTGASRRLAQETQALVQLTGRFKIQAA